MSLSLHLYFFGGCSAYVSVSLWINVSWELKTNMATNSGWAKFTFLLPCRISWVGGRPTGRPLLGLKVFGEATEGGEETPLSEGRMGGIFLGGGTREVELLEAEIEERDEFVVGETFKAWRSLSSELAGGGRRSSAVETLAGSTSFSSGSHVKWPVNVFLRLPGLTF